jgi:serine/threonine protein kinase
MNQPISPTPAGANVAVATSLPPSAGGNQAEVCVYVGLDSAAKYEIQQGEYIIGRDPSCHIVVEADGVSRRHARLTFTGYELLIEDLESANGVFIEGVQVQLSTRLRPEQQLQVGSARLTVRLSDATARHFSEALWDADLGLAPVREQLEGARYKVLTTVARGGMGVILQARDLRIRRNVAMKVMKTGAQFSKESVLRFIDEAQLTGQLEHPNIVPVYELGIDEHGEAFYAMKFVKGITLDEVLRGLRDGSPLMLSKYPLGALITVFQKICDAVAYAHSRGVIHRDLKPENVMIGDYGEVLVMDWGLAKQISQTENSEPAQWPAVLSPSTSDELRGFETLHGVVVGTPPYISPEQARGELDQIDQRSDVFVLGAILYAILTLRAPVAGDTVEEVLDRIIAGGSPAPVSFNNRVRTRPDPGEPQITLAHCPGGRVPEGLSAVAMKALRTEPGERYQTVEEMQAEIAAFQGGFAPKAEGATPWRQMVLFAGRHKREVALLVIFAVVLQALSIAFAIQTNAEKNRALASELRVREREEDLAKAIDKLRGTAPTFAAEASSLLDQEQPEEALEKIDYAIEQVPNEAEYHLIRANALQSLMRFEDAIAAYEEVLARAPKNKAADENLKLTTKLRGHVNENALPTPTAIRLLHSSLVAQKRVGEALYVIKQIDRDQKLLFETWKATFASRGLKHRFETREDGTLNIDLSKGPQRDGSPREGRSRGQFGPSIDEAKRDLLKLRGAPVSEITLDDVRLTDLSTLRGLPLQKLSMNRVPARDLSPLIGMPLRHLNMDSVPAANLEALEGLPLEMLRISGMRIESLEPLRGMPLEQLNISKCRSIKDLSPLAGMPLQSLDLSGTAVSDLSPLADSPIRELNMEGCVDVVDLRPLMAIKTLESVLLPAHLKDVAFLRAHPTIKRLSYKKLTQPVYEFWQQYDAARKSR